MTCKDKLKELHPSWDKAKIDKVIREDCPEDWDIVDDHGVCPEENIGCVDCWDREIDIVEGSEE